MVKQRSIGPDNMELDDGASSAFLDALRTRAMDDLHIAALEYGIVLKDLAVIDRQFKGEIAATMDKLTTRALQAQVEAAVRFIPVIYSHDLLIWHLYYRMWTERTATR